MTTYQVNVVMLRGFSDTEVLLDNQAAIMEPVMLHALHTVKDHVHVNGVSGLQGKLDQVGYLDDFFEVYTSDSTRVNILSFSEVEELYPFTYEPFIDSQYTCQIGTYCSRSKFCGDGRQSTRNAGIYGARASM